MAQVIGPLPLIGDTWLKLLALLGLVMAMGNERKNERFLLSLPFPLQL